MHLSDYMDIASGASIVLLRAAVFSVGRWSARGAKQPRGG